MPQNSPSPSERATTSIVIPVKDDAALLERCLLALRAQTSPPDDIVVVDNGSSDASAAVAERFGVRLVRQPGGGIPAARSAGYDAATGDIVVAIDADCLPERHWLAALEQDFREHPEVSAFTGAARFIDGPRILRRALAVLYLGSYYLLLLPALGHPPVFGSNFAMRRSLWLEIAHDVHRHDAFVHDDLDLSFHVGPPHRVRYSPRWPIGISMRPFFNARSFVVRLRRGGHTVAVHWPEHLPWLRWQRQWAAARHSRNRPARTAAPVPRPREVSRPVREERRVLQGPSRRG
jgi:glycosyltransferase involved in cell wall biosynthesis